MGETDTWKIRAVEWWRAVTDVSRAQTREKLHFLWAHQGRLSIRDSFVKHKRRKWILGRGIKCKSASVWSHIAFFLEITLLLIALKLLPSSTEARHLELSSTQFTGPSLNACCVVGPQWDAFRALAHWILAALFSHYTDEKIDTQRGEESGPGMHSNLLFFPLPPAPRPPQRYQQTTAELFFPRSYPSGKMSSQQTSRPIGVTL